MPITEEWDRASGVAGEALQEKVVSVSEEIVHEN